MKSYEDNFYKRLNKIKIFVKSDIFDKYIIPIITGILGFGLFYVLVTLLKSKIGS